MRILIYSFLLLFFVDFIFNVDENYYETLEISENATQEVIKGAYRKLSLKHHPDKNLDKQEEATEKFKKINNAYAILSNPEEKEKFDKKIKNKKKEQESQAKNKSKKGASSSKTKNDNNKNWANENLFQSINWKLHAINDRIVVDVEMFENKYVFNCNKFKIHGNLINQIKIYGNNFTYDENKNKLSIFTNSVNIVISEVNQIYKKRTKYVFIDDNVPKSDYFEPDYKIQNDYINYIEINIKDIEIGNDLNNIEIIGGENNIEIYGKRFYNIKQPRQNRKKQKGETSSTEYFNFSQPNPKTSRNAGTSTNAYGAAQFPNYSGMPNYSNFNEIPNNYTYHIYNGKYYINGNEVNKEYFEMLQSYYSGKYYVDGNEVTKEYFEIYQINYNNWNANQQQNNSAGTSQNWNFPQTSHHAAGSSNSAFGTQFPNDMPNNTNIPNSNTPFAYYDSKYYVYGREVTRKEYIKEWNKAQAFKKD